MTVPAGIKPYDLAVNFCEECGRAKSLRLLTIGTLTGCRTCDEVTTRHRCTDRPAIGELADGASWECGDCGSTWIPGTVTERCEDCCGECGHTVQARRWSVIEGDRMSTAPKYTPGPYSLLGYEPVTVRSKPGKCHTTANGVSVHVKPGCRCPEQGGRR